MLWSSLAGFALLSVLERSRETEEGSTKALRDLEHMCYRERRRKLGLVSPVKRAKELSQSYLQLSGGDSNEGGGIKLILVIPYDKTRNNGPKLWIQRFRLTLGKKKKKIT